jgi:hypothetical protein
MQKQFLFVFLILFLLTSLNLLYGRYHDSSRGRLSLEPFNSITNSEASYFTQISDSPEAVTEFTNTLFKNVFKMLNSNSDLKKSMVSYYINNNMITKDPSYYSSSHSLKDYCVFGSFQSASTGDYVSMTAIFFLLSAGVRYLDIEIFYDTTRLVPVIGKTNNGNSQVALNTILFSDFCLSLKRMLDQNVLGETNLLLFLQLRIHCPSNMIASDMELYFSIISTTMKNYSLPLLPGKINPNTPPLSTPFVNSSATLFIILDTIVCPKAQLNEDLDSIVNLYSNGGGGGNGNASIYMYNENINNLSSNRRWNICYPETNLINSWLTTPLLFSSSSGKTSSMENPDPLISYTKIGMQVSLFNFSLDDPSNMEIFFLIFNNGDNPYLNFQDVIRLVYQIKYLSNNN